MLALLVLVLSLSIESHCFQAHPSSNQFSNEPYVHIDKPVCVEGDCNYQKNLRSPKTVDEHKKKISDTLRMLAYLGMAEGIDGHISVRTPTPSNGDNEKMYLLMDRFGVGWNIISPEHIVTIECGTKKIMESNSGSIEWRAAIWMNDIIDFRKAIHQIRPDVNVVLHLHAPYSRIIGATNQEWEMIDQNSLRFYNKIGYHDYEGVVVDPKKSESLANKIKEYNILILRNHGAIILADNVEMAFNSAYFLENAAKAQIDTYVYASAAGKKVIKIDPPVVETNWKKFQGQAEHLFAYFNFESYRRYYGLINEKEEKLFFDSTEEKTEL